MIKLKYIVKLYYPINAIFNKVLPKWSVFVSLHIYLVCLVDAYRLRLVVNHAESELGVFERAQTNKVNLVWDCYTSPVTYGDFVDFCLLGRYLKSKNCEIIFTIAADKFREDWDVVYPDIHRKRWFINQLKDIGEFLIPDTVVHIIEDNFSQIDFDSSVIYTPFEREVISRGDRQIFKYFEAMVEIQFMREPTAAFLLDGIDCQVMTGLDRYICWHIRASSAHSPTEDESPEDILKFYDLITAETHLPILVISSVTALPYLKGILGDKSNVIFSKDIFDGFLNDAKLILGSCLYIQCGWGGAFTIPVASKIPYLGPPLERGLAPWQMLKRHVRIDNMIRPWASTYQKTFSDYDDFEYKLKKLATELAL